MRTTLLALGIVSLLSLPTMAQSDARSHCPTGYQAVAGVCQDSQSGDIVLPD